MSIRSNVTFTQTMPGADVTFGPDIHVSVSDNATCIDVNARLRLMRNDLTTYLSVQAVFGLLYVTIFVLSVCGNAVVIVAVLGNKQLRSVRNLFIVSLSCSDVVVSVFSNVMTPVAGFAKVWLFGRAMCYLVPSMQGISICVSTFTLTSIAIDRFILIIYPSKRPINQRQAIAISALIWMMAGASVLPMTLHYQLRSAGKLCGVFCVEIWNRTEEDARRLYGTTLMISSYLLPIIIITVCYMCICVRLSKRPILRPIEYTNGSTLNTPLTTLNNTAVNSDKKKSRQVSTGAKSNTSLLSARSMQSVRREAAARRRLRTNRMLISMVVVFSSCMLPMVAFNLLRDYNWLPYWMLEQSYFCGILTHCIAMTTTVWNPLLYAWLNKQFRQAFICLLFPDGSARRRRAEAAAGRFRTTATPSRGVRRSFDDDSHFVTEFGGAHPPPAVQRISRHHSTAPYASGSELSTYRTPSRMSLFATPAPTDEDDVSGSSSANGVTVSSRTARSRSAQNMTPGELTPGGVSFSRLSPTGGRKSGAETSRYLSVAPAGRGHSPVTRDEDEL